MPGAKGLIDKATGIFTGMLAGYLIGMTVGFTAFDPDWDVWALLSFVLALAGIGVGLLPVIRRHRSVILGTIVGFYLGLLFNFLVFGDVQENGLDLFQNGIGGFLCVAFSVTTGAWLGWRYRSEALGYTLFAATFGGFLGGLGLGTVLGLGEGTSMLTWAVPVIFCSALLGGITWRLQTSNRKPTQQ